MTLASTLDVEGIALGEEDCKVDDTYIGDELSLNSSNSANLMNP